MRTVWRCSLALFFIWLLAAGAIFLVERSRPTPQKFMSYVAEHPVQGQSAPERAKIIKGAASIINGFDSEQRREIKKSGALRGFFVKLTSEERRRFSELTLPAGFSSMIKTLNKMLPEERKKVAARTLRDLRRGKNANDKLGEEDDLHAMLSRGSSIFEKEADPQVQLDFAPVFEELKREQKKAKPDAPSQLPQ